MGQVVDYLRLSVTDRCNYRCVYCMPSEGVPFKSHEEMLSYEDMVFFVRAAVQMGISKVRVTGGEPLVRRGLPDLIGMLHDIPQIHDVSLTTNGVLLPRFVKDLKRQGLDRVNISLDSLDSRRYRAPDPRRLVGSGPFRGRGRPSVRSEPGEVERGHDARAACRTPGLRLSDQGPSAPRALHRVDAGGGLWSAIDRANRSPKTR